MIEKTVRFFRLSNAAPTGCDLLLVVEYEAGRPPVTISGEYQPGIGPGETPWRHTGGDAVRGRVLAWAVAPVVNHFSLSAQHGEMTLCN